jgi:heme/copper-type cytochrome/quinol oxidase subunit 2
LEAAEITLDVTADAVDAADAVISAIVIVMMSAIVTNVRKKEEEHSAQDLGQVVMIRGATAVGVTVTVTAIVIVIAIVNEILMKIFSNRDYRSGGLHRIQASAFTYISGCRIIFTG